MAVRARERTRSRGELRPTSEVVWRFAGMLFSAGFRLQPPVGLEPLSPRRRGRASVRERALPRPGDPGPAVCGRVVSGSPRMAADAAVGLGPCSIASLMQYGSICLLVRILRQPIPVSNKTGRVTRNQRSSTRFSGLGGSCSTDPGVWHSRHDKASRCAARPWKRRDHVGSPDHGRLAGSPGHGRLADHSGEPELMS